MGKEEFIAVPHFINPQLFWYHKADGQNPTLIELQRIEESVQALYTAKQSAALRPYRPFTAEIVAVAFVSWNKYIRARVEHIVKYTQAEDQYIVWALDYGFPFQTKVCYIRKLPDTHTELTDHICRGAIANVLPAELDFDFVTTTSRIVCKEYWSQRAVELVEKITNDAASVSFIEFFCVEEKGQKQHFGDLRIINHSGEEVFVSDYLIKLNFAVKCVDDFRNRLGTLKSTKMKCWETNSKDVKIIENKLNTLNMHYAQGRFNLSGTASDNSYDTSSKQKVMDWCERNLTNTNAPETDALGPTFALDATDISFDDSVSVTNYKEQSRNDTQIESVMGYAGTLQESRKKYEGKVLPPKPAMEAFEVIPEKNKSGATDDLNKSSVVSGSVTTRRAKALIDLRNKLQKEREEVENIQEEAGKLGIGSSPSESSTEVFLENCKMKNAESKRLQKLKKLRQRRTEDTNSNNDSNSSPGIAKETEIASSVSSRYLLLKKIKEKHSKTKADQSEQIDGAIGAPNLENQSEVHSQSESKISAHAAKLISMRKKIKEKYSQSENSASDIHTNNDSAPINPKAPQESQEVIGLEPSSSQSCFEPPDDTPPPVKHLDSESENLEFRKLIHGNPFQNMTMVPAGYDVTKLVKRNNEETHWHTKKTTLNESFRSNYSASELPNGSGNTSFGICGKQPVARRTENVEEQNFRLTRPRKERKKHGMDGKPDEKHLLDLSLNDADCPPAIIPVVVPGNSITNLSQDLVILNDTADLTAESATINSCLMEFSKTEKLIDLSATDEPWDALNISAAESSDSFLEFVKEKSYTKDTSREYLLESQSTNDTSDSKGTAKALIEEELESVNAKVCSSPSISCNSFTKLESMTHISEKLATDADSYEEGSSSFSSGSVREIETVNQAPAMEVNSEPTCSSALKTHRQFILPLIKKSLGTSSEKEKRLKSEKNKEALAKIMSDSSSLQICGSILNESLIQLPELANETSLKTNFIQHLVLAHSTVKVTPIERMTSALFSPEIHQEMEQMRLTKMYRIQSYAWAHLVRGNSFYVINASRTGKTWCYLPPLCSMVGFRLESQSLPQTYGPVAIIIAPSSVQVESISRHCRRLLSSTKTHVTIVPSYAFRNADEVKIQLHNGCGILVITPSSLQRLLVANERESLLNFERIQYVVIDDLDTMMSQDRELDEILNKFIGPVLQQQENGKVPFQMVVTSKRWSPHMIKLLRISNQPLLCIADYLEAAVYAKNKLSIKFQSSVEKMAVMIKCLEKCPYSLERVVIICSTDDEADLVEQSLLEAGYACLVYTGRMPVDYLNLVNEWKLKTICHQVLVTVDGVLPELLIQNVWTLIHYSLPTSWTKFNFRFSTFLQNYNNIIALEFKKLDKVPNSIILLDEQNNLQLPRLIEFMKHHHQLKHIHPNILTVSARVTAEREELRVDQGILMCPKILEFGSCDETNRCAHRHQLTRYDGAIEGIPTQGEVRLKILDVLSPTHYTARLLTHKIGKTMEVVRRSNEVTHFLMQLTFHFMNEDAQIIHWPLRVNDLCVYKGEGIFHRCRLLEVPPIAYENIVKLVNVKIKLIDSGPSLMCKSHDLLMISENFRDFPAQAVDIRLSGVVPFDNERVWDTRSTRAVKQWIMHNVKDNDCLQASINFSLMDTIWVNDLILMEKLNTIRGYAIKCNVRRSLLGKRFALADDAMHLVKQTAIENGLINVENESPKNGEPVEKFETEQNLLEFSSSTFEDASPCELPKVNTPDPVIKSINNSARTVSKRVIEEWMKLTIDELTQVKVTQLHDPSKFYVRLFSQEVEFKELEDVILGHKKIELEDPHPMQNCLAPRDGQYYRAKIQRLIIDSAEGCVQARVFFCDLGLFSNLPLEELRSSSKDIIEYIPFQSICCKLTGLSVESVGEEVQKVIQMEKSIHMAYAVKEISDLNNYDEGFNIYNYEVILYECLTDKSDIQINKQLVERGLAVYDDNTKHYLELDSKLNFAEFEYEQGEPANSSYDFQSFLDRLQQQMDEEDAEEEQIYKTKSMAINDEEPKIVEISADSDSTEMIETSPDSMLPTLRALHKRPLTSWYETMCMIFLVIHAPDISDYHLEVTPKRLLYVATVNGEEQMLVLDFLGYVEPDQVTHELRGLNVVVRLVKSVYMEWPRLLQDPTKFPWLTYNLNAIDAMEAEQLINGKRRLPPKTRIASYSSTGSETSDSNPCETFTPIVNVDELHDPMEELY